MGHSDSSLSVGDGIVTTLNLNQRTTVRREFANSHAPLADDGSDRTVIDKELHTPALLVRSDESRCTKLGDGRELHRTNEDRQTRNCTKSSVSC